MDYFDGEDGETPVKGVDYFDGADGKDADMTEVSALIQSSAKNIQETVEKKLVEERIYLGTKTIDETTLRKEEMHVMYDPKKDRLVYKKRELDSQRTKFFGNNSPVNPKVSWRVVTSNYTLTNEDGLILADATGGAFSITLPDANAFDRWQFTIKRTNSNNNRVTIALTGSNLIDSKTSFLLVNQNSLISVVSAADSWWITSN